MASHGIHGAVDAYGDLPAAAQLDLGTTFLVRQDTGAPSGAGLYWVCKTSGGRAWEFLDGLSLQRADEVPYANGASGLSGGNVQAAIDELAGSAVTGLPVHSTDETPGTGENVCPPGGSFFWHELSTGRTCLAVNIGGAYALVELGELT